LAPDTTDSWLTDFVAGDGYPSKEASLLIGGVGGIPCLIIMALA
jgi:hypothetical protein